MFIELLKKRRSIRSYTGESLTEEQVRRIMTAALLSPSSRNIRPWEFVLVRERKTLEYLSEAKHGAKLLAGVALGVVILGDTEKSDVWVEDCSIVASNILLAATDMNLGACWVQIRNRSHRDGESAAAYVRRRLSVPGRFDVEAIIGIGIPAENKPPLDENDLDWNKLHQETFK